MSDSKPVLPTITMGIGILIGGLAGSAAGAASSNELVTVVAYVVGFLGGAAIGGCVGWRWHRLLMERSGDGKSSMSDAANDESTRES